ncbi:hypothetical protein HDU86_004566 [Geranomyces michiganensis]|nr:hypothetical protein HDU86_004566 [Geranomyces michiganensis]
MSFSQPRRPPDGHDTNSSSGGFFEPSYTCRQQYTDHHSQQLPVPSSACQQQQQLQSPLPHQQPTTQFISKIAQVVLRSRVRPPPAPLPFIDALVLANHPEFWRNSVPVNVDIYLAASHTLLERWVVSYQPNPATSASPTTSSILSWDQKRKADLTELILMVQALYSYIRLMPLHSLLTDGAQLEKADLHYYVSTADGCPLSPGSDSGASDGVASDVDSVEFDMCAPTPLSSSSSSSSLSAVAPVDECVSPHPTPLTPPPAPKPIAFDLAAKLKVYKFRSASTASDGRLHLSVVYDASVAGMVPVSLSAAKASRSPTKAPGPPLLPFGPIPTRQRSSGSVTKADADAMNTDGGESFERRRSSASLGSPFPSPTMQKRVLSFAHWKLTAATAPSSPPTVDTAALPPLALLLPPPTQSTPAHELCGNEPLDLGIMVLDSADGDAEGGQNSSTRPMGRPYGEPMRYRSPGDAGFSSSTSLSTRGSRRPDLRIDIPPSPRFDHGTAEQQHRSGYRRRSSPAHHHHMPSHHTQRHSHHHHQHRHHHHSHHAHHHHSHTDKAPSPTTTIRSIDIPLPAFPSGGFSSFSPSSSNHRMHSQRPPNGSYGSSSTTPADLFGALVGSYEESILSGRMSALPSKPLRFIAELGAMAHGRCPPGLRCPPHLVIPFDAFFYEVGEEETVTPYVGSVNVGEAAANAERKAKEEAAAAAVDTAGPGTLVAEGAEVGGVPAVKGADVANVATHVNTAMPGRTGKNPNSSGSSRNDEHPSRGYRIPPKGQLQIVIKNPSRTAIKLFLLPYDVRDLPPYGKTLLRQKSYASTAAAAPSTTSSTTMTSSTTSPPPPRILRHAVHVPIHRTKRSVYLGPLVRVVFSSRGADEKERCSVVTEMVGAELHGVAGSGAEAHSHSRRRGSGVTPAR